MAYLFSDEAQYVTGAAHTAEGNTASTSDYKLQ